MRTGPDQLIAKEYTSTPAANPTNIGTGGKRQIPSATTKAAITTHHLANMPSSNLANATWAVTTPPNANNAAIELPNAREPPAIPAEAADCGPCTKKASETSTPTTAWQATARSAVRRPAANEFSTRTFPTYPVPQARPH
jgi:hypothetical protein